MEQGVVGRDQVRRGQPEAKLVTQPVAQPARHRERHEEQDRESHREKDREVQARVKEFVGDDDKLLTEYQQDRDADSDIDIDIESDQPGEFDQELKDCVDEPRRVSRRVLRRESLRAWLRVHVSSSVAWLRARIQVWLHAERECCVMALGDQLRGDKCDCERTRVQIAQHSVARNKVTASADSASSTTPWTRTTQLRCGKPRTVPTHAAKVKQVELWRLEKYDLRIKDWEAREIQLQVRVGVKRGCLSELVVRLKHDRVDDDAEDERNEGVLCDCLFPQYYANPGASPSMRRTERGARRDSCDKAHMVFAEGDDIHVLCAIVSVKTAPRRVAQNSSQVMCDGHERSVSSFQGCLFSDPGQS